MLLGFRRHAPIQRNDVTGKSWGGVFRQRARKAEGWGAPSSHSRLCSVSLCLPLLIPVASYISSSLINPYRSTYYPPLHLLFLSNYRSRVDTKHTLPHTTNSTFRFPNVLKPTRSSLDDPLTPKTTFQKHKQDEDQRRRRLGRFRRRRWTRCQRQVVWQGACCL